MSFFEEEDEAEAFVNDCLVASSDSLLCHESFAAADGKCKYLISGAQDGDSPRIVLSFVNMVDRRSHQFSVVKKITINDENMWIGNGIEIAVNICMVVTGLSFYMQGASLLAHFDDHTGAHFLMEIEDVDDLDYIALLLI